MKNGVRLWRFSKKRTLITRKGKIMLCGQCPCGCQPKIIVEWTSNNNGGQGKYKCFDLTPYQKDWIGTPGARWRIIETGACLTYHTGDINGNGKLIGLPSSYCSKYNYDGHMVLQMGCPITDSSSTKWATRCY